MSIGAEKLKGLKETAEGAGIPSPLVEKMCDFLRMTQRADLIEKLETLVQGAQKDRAPLKAELEKYYSQRLQFGTAGLRGEMGPGFNRMNDVVVRQAAQGLCAYLIDLEGSEVLKKKRVVVGFDARYNSQKFAHLTAAVFASRGVRAYLFGDISATPLVPFTVRKLGCAAGVMVTASHNPKNDNGYKVYAGNGAQIIPPTDEDIATSILKNLEPWDGVSALLSPETGLLKDPSEKSEEVLQSMWDAYTETISKELCTKKALTSQSTLKIVYTAMHGVGCEFVKRTVEAFGFSLDRLLLVSEQCTPDPEFPTVPFPNPEEKGALDLALSKADASGTPLVIANDPDADRFAAAEKLPSGQWKVFSGDELGVIFSLYRLECLKKEGVAPGDIFFICSAVSSAMLSVVAKTEGCHWEDTMTGFKWMSNKSLELKKDPKKRHAVAYEEAIGYQLSEFVSDKDGVSAAAVWAEMCCHLYAESRTVNALLEEAKKKYGYFVTNNAYYLCYDPPRVKACFDAFRSAGGAPQTYLKTIGGFEVLSIRDVTTGFDCSKPDKKCTFPLTPTSQMVTISFSNGARITLRTSGTEPKIKWYSEFSGEDEGKAKEELDRIVAAVCSEVLNAEKWGFIDPRKK